MPVICFTKLGNKYSDLLKKFNDEKKLFKEKNNREINDHEERELATKVALGFHADVTKRLNGIIDQVNKVKEANGETKIERIKGKQENVAKDVSKVIKEYSKTIKTEQDAIPKHSTGEVLQRQQDGNGEQGGERRRVEQTEQGKSSTTGSKPTEKTTETKQSGGSGGIDATANG